MSNIQKTLSIIKPDAVQRNLTEEIKSIFKKNGFELTSEKKIKISKEEAEKSAARYGCVGAHKMGEEWMPCKIH